ncbi:MAG: hypothetical protein NWP87_05535, partial [Winogradskyella sp.]|nr:hypothetical protein [Winogradskyella sp.]
MKQLSKLCAIALLVAFASCEKNESIEETLDQEVQHLQLRVIDGNVVGDGEEDLELQFNENSEILVKPSQTTFGKSSITEGLVGSDLTDFLATMLPSQVTVTTTSKPGNDAYFNLSIEDNSGFLSGTGLPAWCTDQDLSLENNETLTFDVYSTYGGLPDDKFEMPENFDKVNWLINQTIIGEESPNGLGTYTFGHFQYAIWLLIDDSVCELCTFLTDPTGTWNADGNDVAQAQEIRDLALAQGNGFVPTVGELMAIVLIPEGKQSVIIGKEVQAI